jgi:hypothetical protein
VVEFAPPLALLSLPEGHFTRMLRETGPASFNELKRVTEAKAAREGNPRHALDLYADPYNIVAELGDLKNRHPHTNLADIVINESEQEPELPSAQILL